MSGTYRYRLAYITVPDGVLDYGHGKNARKARAENKRIDRRIKRREHQRTIQQAMREYETEHNWLTLMDQIYEEECLDIYDEDYLEYLADYEDDYRDDHPGYNDDYWDPYDDCYGHYESDFDEYGMYSSGYLTREGLTRLDLNARVKDENVGESLGDILARALAQSQ